MKKAAFVLVTLVGLFLIWPSAPQAFQIITRDMVEKELVTRTDLIRNQIHLTFDRPGVFIGEILLNGVLPQLIHFIVRVWSHIVGSDRVVIRLEHND